MVGYYNQGVPTSAELEDNGNRTKYTVNRTSKGDCVISKLLCVLMSIGVVLLLLLAVLLTFIFHPGCGDSAPEALVEAPEKMHNVRLPRSVLPIHYRLQVIPSLDNFTTSGAVTISLNVTENVDKIVLNAYELEIDPDSVEVKKLSDSSSKIVVGDQSYDNVSQTYTIHLEEQLKGGQQYELEMKFVGLLNENMQGFYASHYYDPKLNTVKWMASTQFSPTDARRAFPCFDEPSFKAKFTISLARPNNMTTLSNMPKKETDQIVDKQHWVFDHYLETPLMSSYLVTFVVSNLQAFRYNSSGKFVTVWTRIESFPQTRLAIDMGPRILNYFEDYFDIKFPLPKVDIVAVPDFGYSAMENWGILTFKENTLLYDETIATIDDKRSIVVTMAHEIGHQWFGNLVTMQWWDDLWLNEGFATYLGYLGTSQVQSSWNIMDEFAVTEIQKAFKIDSLLSSHPISFEVHNTDDIQQMFDSISYSKGGAIIRMLNHILGEASFRQGLVKYLKRHKYANAVHDDLWDALNDDQNAKLKDTSVKEIMDTWTTQAGFPVVTAEKNYDNKQVTLSQKRFLLSPNSQPDESGSWYIPISYASDTRTNNNFATLQNSSTSPELWLRKEKAITVELDANDWYLLNVQQTGYYIVNYDERNWKMLARSVMNFLPVLRAQLITDSMDLARAGLLDYNVPLQIITNMATQDREIALVPMMAAFDKLTYLENMMATTSGFGKFNEFISRIFTFAFKNVKLKDELQDTYVAQRVRRLVTKWSCKRSPTDCSNTAQKLYRDWMIDPDATVIPPNIKEVVFCTAIREGGESEWDYAYRRYGLSMSSYEKNTILNALGCTTIPWILSRYLDFVLKNDTGIRKQDSPRIFKSVANNLAGRTLAFDYLRTNWKEINDYYGSGFNTVSKMVDELPIFMNTPFELSQLKEFRTINLNSMGTSTEALDRAIERVEANVEWRKHHYRSVDKWLDDLDVHYHGN